MSEIGVQHEVWPVQDETAGIASDTSYAERFRPWDHFNGRGAGTGHDSRRSEEEAPRGLDELAGGEGKYMSRLEEAMAVDMVHKGQAVKQQLEDASSSREELIELRRDTSNGERAFGVLLQWNQGLIQREINKVIDKPMMQHQAEDDLWSRAMRGMHDAIERFDTSRGYTLWTYAQPWVFKRLQEAASEGRSVPVSRIVLPRLVAVDESAARLARTTGQYPSNADIRTDLIASGKAKPDEAWLKDDHERANVLGLNALRALPIDDTRATFLDRPAYFGSGQSVLEAEQSSLRDIYTRPPIDERAPSHVRQAINGEQWQAVKHVYLNSDKPDAYERAAEAVNERRQAKGKTPATPEDIRQLYTDGLAKLVAASQIDPPS